MEKQYKEVDVLEYVKEGLKNGTLKFKESKKFQRIQARQGVEGEIVETILADGTLETTRSVTLDKVTGKPGWIVKNIDGPEQWIIDDSVFQKKYVADEEQPGLSIYRPKGGPMLAAQINESLKITPPNWGGATQVIDAGGYILMDPANLNDVYGIGETEFNNSYQFTNNAVNLHL